MMMDGEVSFQNAVTYARSMKKLNLTEIYSPLNIQLEKEATCSKVATVKFAPLVIFWLIDVLTNLLKRNFKRGIRTTEFLNRKFSSFEGST